SRRRHTRSDRDWSSDVALPICSAYLTVSEIFPLEIRAVAIAIFYAIGTLAGGVGAPLLFGWIIGTGSITALFTGYLLAAALMIRSEERRVGKEWRIGWYGCG